MRYGEALTERSADRSYVGIRTRYKMFLRQTGMILDGAGEKIDEAVKRVERGLVGKGRRPRPIHLSGRVGFADKTPARIVFVGDESGTRRSGIPRRYEPHFDPTRLLTDSFSTTAADGSGRVAWFLEDQRRARA